MLKLDQPSTFSAQILGFTGDGTLTGSDQIDLKGINFSTVHDSYANGVLTVTDGTHGAALNFHGTYTLANFKFADDGNGGTIVYDPPVPGLSPTGQGAHVSVDLSSDAFVFHPNLGLSASELKPETAPNHNEHTEFAATHSTMHDAHENITPISPMMRSLRTTPRSHNFTKVICLFNPLRCSVRINWTDEVRRLIIQQARQ